MLGRGHFGAGVRRLLLARASVDNNGLLNNTLHIEGTCHARLRDANENRCHSTALSLGQSRPVEAVRISAE